MGALRKLERRRIAHRKSPRAERVPFGYARKISDVIVELAQPLARQATNPQQFRLAIDLAALCWNLSLAPADKRGTLVDDALRKLVKPGESMDGLRHILASLIARKEALFPDDRRVITSYWVSGGGPEDADVVIQYAVPEQT